MNQRLEFLRQTALTIAKQFKSHNLRDFIPRRVEDRIKQIQSLSSEEQIESEMAGLEQLIRSAERQLPIQNMYQNDQSVLDT